MNKRSSVGSFMYFLIFVGLFWIYTYHLENVYVQKQLGVLGSLENAEQIDQIAYAFFDDHSIENVEKGKKVLEKLGYPKEAFEDLKKDYHLSAGLLVSLSLGLAVLVVVGIIHDRKRYRTLVLDQLEHIMNRHYVPAQTLDPLTIQLNQLNDFLIQKENESTKIKERSKLFIEDIAHQIKTPLTSLKLYVETSNDIKTQENGSFQIKRIERIVSALIDLARLEAHAIQFRMEVSSLQVCLEEVLEELQPVYAKKDICVISEVDDVIFSFDRLWIGEAMINILRNAIEYTPRQGEVTLRTIVHEHIVIIEVNDQGPGFSEASAQHLFDRFYSGNEPTSRKSMGMGIGLNIAMEVVKAHHGHLYASSQPKGACFILELPINHGKEKC